MEVGKKVVVANAKENRTLLREEDEIGDRWLGHFDDMPNVENEKKTGFRRDSTSRPTYRDQ